MATITITISLIPGTTKLFLQDTDGHSGEAHSFFTNVNRGDKIIWELAKDSGIDDITGIKAKDGFFNILKNGAPKRDKKGWKGFVKDDAAGKDSYNIDYVVNGVPLSEDPIVQVPPPPTPADGITV